MVQGRVPTSLVSRNARRPNVGLLTTGFAYGPERRLFDGMLAAARRLDVNLLCFHGQRLNSRIPADRRANVLYQLVDRENCDALVVWSGALGEHVSLDELRAFCLSFGLPVVTIGDSLEGIPSIVFDFYAGMREQMMHLVDVHHYQRIAFIRGPEGHNEAEQRYRAYREVLVQRGLGFDERLVVPGNFLRRSGRQAVSVLLDERGVSFDAIAAVNDETALGALEELSRRRIGVPHPIALIGFDDDDAVRWTSPPLTTVRFCIDAAGERALGMLLAELRGRSEGQRQLLLLEVKIRESCGCPPHASGGPGEGSLLLEQARGSFAFAATHTLETSSPLSFVRAKAEDWARSIYDAFCSDVSNKKSSSLGVLRSVLDESLVDRPAYVGPGGQDSSIAVQLEATAWHDILNALHGRVVADRKLDAEESAHERHLIWQMSRTIVDFAQRLPTFGGWVREQHIWQVQEIGHKLLHTFNLAALARAAAEALPEVGIKRFAISLYEKGEVPGSEVRLLAGSNGEQVLPLSGESPLFSSRALAPSVVFGKNGQFTLAIEPLIFDDHQLGFAVFEIETAAQGAIIVALRKQLAAALEGAVLIGQLEQRAHELEQAHRVQEEQKVQLVVAERMAWLGRLTAGIAHEMNTPVAAVRSSLSTLSDLIEEYRSSIGDTAVLPHDHHDLANDMAKVTQLAKKAAENAAKFVAELKMQTRDLGPQAVTVFNVVPVLHEALGLLRHPLEASGSTIVYQPTSDFIRVSGSPSRLAQVMTNLVVNAIDAQAAKNGGVISIGVGHQGGAVLLEVVDRGEGIPDHVLPRVFEPMFSTRSYGQHIGLGLSTARDIIESEFGGTIAIESRVGEGTTVRVRIPLPKAE